MQNLSEVALAKKSAAESALDFVKSGMLIGLGTGSTSHFFIEALAKKCQAGLKIQAVASSERSEELAKQLNIPLISHHNITRLDLTVDGADEIDANNQMIKGGGGALLREKILATSSNQMIAIVDESKCVKNLGSFSLPLEICSFAYKTTIDRLKNLGFSGKLREKEGSLYLTDNQNFIFDIHLNRLLENPLIEQNLLKSISGVLETGLFIDVADLVIIGYKDGSVKIRK